MSVHIEAIAGIGTMIGLSKEPRNLERHIERRDAERAAHAEARRREHERRMNGGRPRLVRVYP